VVIGRARIAFAAFVVVAIAAAACGTIAELDVKYDSVSVAVDGGSGDSAGDIDAKSEAGSNIVIGDSSFVESGGEAPVLDPSDAGPCEPDSDDGGGCDFAQGLGCCLLQGGASRCIFQWEIAAKCTNGLFVGCRADDPNSQSACCWRDGPPGSGARMSVLGTSCNGGVHACTADAGCVTGSCAENACPLSIGGSFTVGSCGTAEACP
jgi:hypothetical protein